MAILDGIRVLDFGRYIAGPLCGTFLADLGAEVIRVEKPDGADDRYIMPVTERDEGALYLHSNRGKKSLTLDTARPEGRRAAERLIATADVVIANLSPRALKHFGLDYETVRGIREDIILTTVNAFGSEGPMREAVGFDGVGQAVSGAVHLTGELGRPYRSATAYVDFSTALSSAFGTLGAIVERMRSGRGSHVETSLVGTALNVMAPILIEHASGRHNRVPTGNRAPIAGPSDIFHAKDGWFIMQVQGPKMFRRWAELVQRPDLIDDPRFATDPLRGRNGAVLSAVMTEWAAERTVGEAIAILEGAGLAASPVLTPDQVMGGALELVEGFTRPTVYPGAAGLRLFRPPFQLSSMESEMNPPPTLGAHTREILADAGFTSAEMDELARIRVI
ncbi:CoA transferase [Sphingomonas sp. CL5.1]|uniref:CaiB/BaiF CoA transferase family protein n=1 Tax=Sphingomonas sp. CL5.1 TaxID=2653203 RepID=UPI0015839319|nr:CoA transferase [Sphingomonas sp. CL5.1]QKS00613.1 CoA transferase [Sphingomonas sp. CL5.1]